MILEVSKILINFWYSGNNLFKRIYRDFCGQENLPMYSNFVSMKNKDDQPNLEDKLYQNQPDGSWMRVLKPDSELFK